MKVRRTIHRSNPRAQKSRAIVLHSLARHSPASALLNLTAPRSVCFAPAFPLSTPLNALASSAIIPFQQEYTGNGRPDRNALCDALSVVEVNKSSPILYSAQTSNLGRNVFPEIVLDTPARRTARQWVVSDGVTSRANSQLS